MKRKLLSLLAILMMVFTAQAATITVTWNKSDINDNSARTSFTKDGVTVYSDCVDAYGDDVRTSIRNLSSSTGSFTTTLGNFTKIEVTAMNDISGSGWSGNSSKRTWEGEASSSVSFQGSIMGYSGITIVFTIEEPAPAATGPEVAWNKAEKTGTFKMPAGNVELEPEYYPQATVADGGVTAADADARATTDDPLVKVDATKLTGATKLMYFVSNSGTTAPAYDAEGWTDQLPNAEGITQQGIVYVWYYPVGTDEGVDGATATYSDGDICLQSITARIAAAPTYAVTFAEGTDPNEWTASPATGVTKGETVTVTYTGTKKVIGVKAEKKAAAKPVTLATALEDGAIIKVYFKWRNQNKGDYVQGVYNAASGTFTVSKGGGSWAKDGRAVYKVEKSGDNIIIGAGLSDYNTEGMVWTFNTTNDTYTTTNGADVKQFPTEYGLISVSVNDTDITSTLSELK